jgi:hypothetical protein
MYCMLHTTVTIILFPLTLSVSSRGSTSEPCYRYLLFRVINQFNVDVNTNDRLGVGHGLELLKPTFLKARKKIYPEDGGSRLLQKSLFTYQIKQSYTPEHSDLHKESFASQNHCGQFAYTSQA